MPQRAVAANYWGPPLDHLPPYPAMRLHAGDHLQLALQVLAGEWLPDVGCDAVLLDLHHRLETRRSRQHQERQFGVCRADLLQSLEPGHQRHAPITDHDVGRRSAPEQPECVAAVLRGYHRTTPEF